MTNIRSAAVNALVVLASIVVFFAGLEIVIRANDLWASHGRPLPAKSPDRFADVPQRLLARVEARKAFLTMPEDWKRRDVTIAGSIQSYYWQGALHVHNADMMRHLGPYPPKQPGVFRIMVVGDSLTYGYGIAEEDTFVHLLNEWLSREGKVEVLNLGVSGHQSEDVAKEIEKFLPLLTPDLVVYAVCLNDFLPSGQGEYYYAYDFPLPDAWKTFVLAHSKAMQFTSDLYDATLRRMHLRRDFLDDVLYWFNSDRERFARDVAHMQTLVSAAGLLPIVGMVVEQSPSHNQGEEAAHVAEEAMNSAGFDVISIADYFSRYNGDRMKVSRWEGHPNEVANYIWAKMLFARLRERVPHASRSAKAPD